MRWIAPAVVLSMLGLLFLQFRSVIEAAMVSALQPLCARRQRVCWTLFALGYPPSAPGWAGLLSVVGSGDADRRRHGPLHRRGASSARARRPHPHARRHRRRPRRGDRARRALRPKIATVSTMAASLLPLVGPTGRAPRIVKLLSRRRCSVGPSLQRAAHAGGAPRRLHAALAQLPAPALPSRPGSPGGPCGGGAPSWARHVPAAGRLRRLCPRACSGLRVPATSKPGRRPDSAPRRACGLGGELGGNRLRGLRNNRPTEGNLGPGDSVVLDPWLFRRSAPEPSRPFLVAVVSALAPTGCSGDDTRAGASG